MVTMKTVEVTLVAILMVNLMARKINHHCNGCGNDMKMSDMMMVMVRAMIVKVRVIMTMWKMMRTRIGRRMMQEKGEKEATI
jgi:hypothetical protein